MHKRRDLFGCCEPKVRLDPKQVRDGALGTGRNAGFGIVEPAVAALHPGTKDAALARHIVAGPVSFSLLLAVCCTLVLRRVC